MEILKEKWEGNTPSDPLNRLKRERGEWGGVLPGKTKRWREFYGMRFECVLAECVGSGLVEFWTFYPVFTWISFLSDGCKRTQGIFLARSL